MWLRPPPNVRLSDRISNAFSKFTPVLKGVHPLVIRSHRTHEDTRSEQPLCDTEGGKEGASRLDEEPARDLLSLCKPSNVLLPCA